MPPGPSAPTRFAGIRRFARFLMVRQAARRSAMFYLLLTAYFQSPRLALVVVATIPLVLAGVFGALLVTGTTLNLQSFMGSIMAIGVAVANAILLVTFSEKHRREGMPALQAGIEGARQRLRPILMTSCAMIAGMVPMALALGEGGEQTAPLGRAVIGGLAAWLIFNGYGASTLAGGSVGQLAFQLRVTPELLWTGLKWALAIGFIGGLFPAVRAARLPVTAALREL